MRVGRLSIVLLSLAVFFFLTLTVSPVSLSLAASPGAENLSAPAQLAANNEKPKAADAAARPATESTAPKNETAPPPAEAGPAEGPAANQAPTQKPSPPPIQENKPLGAAGGATVKPESGEQSSPQIIPEPDRWRIGFPDDPRWERGRLLNPYRQNILKGDYPIIGNDIFLNLGITSESTFEGRRVPTPSNVSSARPGSREFFGRGYQFFAYQNFRFTVDLFKGNTAFKPVDWNIRVSPVVNLNYLRVQELGVVKADVREGRKRLDGTVALQELFAEIKLTDNPRLLPFLGRRDGRGRNSPYYDFTSIRIGTQRFTSDFRGFIFADEEPGIRLFGNSDSNRNQWNLAYFYMLEKDTNSALNTLKSRHQHVYIANFYRQDFLAQGWTNSWSFHFNNDVAGKHDKVDKLSGLRAHYDNNGFLVRPAAVGDFTPHNINAAYFGWTSDGHIGRINTSHAFYYVVGHESHNPIAGRKTHINAQLGALELSIDRDWLKPRVSFFWASGDRFPLDGRATGFDSILDNQNFAGGIFPTNVSLADRGFANPILPFGTSYWNRQQVRLTGSNIALTTPNSLLNNLRSSKDEGQANFVNPGILIYTAGAEAKLTPKLLAQFNLNYLQFHHTDPLKLILFQRNIHKSIGYDLSIFTQYRPLLNDNIILTMGLSSLIPGRGFRDIYSSPTQYTVFIGLKFIY